MDVLWQRQKHLHVILQTLPADCWSIKDQVFVSGNAFGPHSLLIHLEFRYQCLTRTPTTKQWERFKKYAGRVVELSIGRLRNWEVSFGTISFLGKRSTLEPLWPRLTALTLTSGLGWDAVPYTLSFLSPKITDFTLVLPQRSNILLPVLSTASDRCRWLQRIVLDVVVGGSLTIEGVVGLISACRDTLRSLEIRSPFRAEYLAVIATLPHLRTLRLETAQFPCDLPLDAFPSLEEVTILRFHGPRLQHFFSRLRSTNLKLVKVYSIDTIAFKKSIAVLSKFSTSLEVLEIAAVVNLDLPDSLVPHPLFANLRKLHVGCLRWGDGLIHGPCMFRPTDLAIAKLGAAIPNITHLTLGSPTCPNLLCVTFLSLVSLSKTCRDLESLVIKVDLKSMITRSPRGSEDGAGDMGLGGTGGNACKLRRLVVGLSVLPDSPDSKWLVAIGLGKLFPYLTQISVYSGDQHKWGEVERNIKISRRILRNIQESD